MNSTKNKFCPNCGSDRTTLQEGSSFTPNGISKDGKDVMVGEEDHLKFICKDCGQIFSVKVAWKLSERYDEHIEKGEKVSSLETKIIKAKELGVRFKIINPGEGITYHSYGTMIVMPGWTDEEFERQLDIFLSKMESNHFLPLLEKYKLI